MDLLDTKAAHPFNVKSTSGQDTASRILGRPISFKPRFLSIESRLENIIHIFRSAIELAILWYLQNFMLWSTEDTKAMGHFFSCVRLWLLMVRVRFFLTFEWLCQMTYSGD